MGFSNGTRARADLRVDELSAGFDQCLAAFDSHERFGGPSVHFHQRTIERRRALGSPVAAGQDREFCELLYATLTAWGMHRMGPGNTKLAPFNDFSASIAAAGHGVAELGSCVLGCLDDAELDRAAGRLWAVIERIELGPARAKLVAGTKALHHLLPELVPPMDGEYTLSFFFGHKPFGAEGERFSFMLERLNRVAGKCASLIQRRLGPGHGPMDTSATKVIDNAIVGYVLTNG